ncbi:DUF3426 domain-containing protein [Duganella rivi]
MAALDTRAAEALTAEEPEPVLELDDVLDDEHAGAPAEAATEPEPEPVLDVDAAGEPEPVAAAPIPLPAEPAILPANTDALFDLDLDIESEPDLEASIEPEVSAAPLEDIISTEAMSDDELEAALEAELSAMEQTLADVQHDADGLPTEDDAFANMSGGRVEPTWGEPSLDDEPQAGAGPGLNTALAAAADAVFAAEAEHAAAPAPEPEQAPAAISAIDDGLANFLASPDTGSEDDDIPADRSAAAAQTAAPSRDDLADDLDADEEALVQLSSGGLAEAQAERAHAYLHAQADDGLAPANEEQAAPEEPGFVKRDRQRQKFGKAATIFMSLGSVLLVAALLAQAVTTFRNSLAAAMPPLKPALTAACQTLGCKIELPTQIDDLTIEQGELQTLSETAFSFTTLLRNQSSTAQAWPSIELVLDDDKDKRILRRVFTPRDYLNADIAVEHGFAPHTEQAVKLYFELHDLKASGYHIAVFYP